MQGRLPVVDSPFGQNADKIIGVQINRDRRRASTRAKARIVVGRPSKRSKTVGSEALAECLSLVRLGMARAEACVVDARSLDQRMQSLDCRLAALHRNKQIYRLRGQNIFVNDDSVLLQSLNRFKWQS